MKKTYYQPIDKYCELPEELASFMAFPSIDDCITWLEDNGYDSGEYTFAEYHDEDIENVTLVDGNGYFLDGMGSVSCYNTEKDLDAGYEMLVATIKRALDKTGLERLPLNDCVCTLYEDYATLSCCNVPSEFFDERPTIVSVDLYNAIDTDSEVIELGDITDYDDFVMLNDAVCREYDV